VSRNFKDWIPAYLDYASVTEAPRRMHFWSAVGTIAGALRRRVWVDQIRYVWYPSFYIIFVAPPGIVAKSTTIDIATDLLRQLPHIKFGPNSITWQALVTAFSEASEEFEFAAEWHPMSPLTLVASELGSLVNPQDRDMVNLLIEMWDGKKSYNKITKTSGKDAINAPWINIMAGTTPHWVADNMPQAMIGGGLSSRCVFIYADQKERYIAFVEDMVGKEDAKLRLALIEDLDRISSMAGPFVIDKAAKDWEKVRYELFWKDAASRMDDQMLEGYAARKQTHLFKVAMVLSAAQNDARVITLDHLQLAETMLNDLEKDMHKVFSRIGRTEDSMQAERFIEYVKRKGAVSYEEAYRMIHIYFPDFRDFEGILTGAIRSGQLTVASTAAGIVLKGGTGMPVVGATLPAITPDTLM